MWIHHHRQQQHQQHQHQQRHDHFRLCSQHYPSAQNQNRRRVCQMELAPHALTPEIVVVRAARVPWLGGGGPWHRK